jgi:hypothetical protein
VNRFPPLDEALDVARRELDGTDALHEEGAVLPLEDVGVVVAQLDLGPHAAHQQAVVLAHLALFDVDEVEVEVREARPVLVVGLDEPHGDLVDDLVGVVLLDRRLHRLALVGLHVLAAQGLAHELEPLADGLLIGRRAVLPEQEFDHERRHAERAPHAAKQVLAHDQAGERFVRQSVQVVEFNSIAHEASHVSSDGQLDAARRELLSGLDVADVELEQLPLLKALRRVEEERHALLLVLRLDTEFLRFAGQHGRRGTIRSPAKHLK